MNISDSFPHLPGVSSIRGMLSSLGSFTMSRKAGIPMQPFPMSSCRSSLQPNFPTKLRSSRASEPTFMTGWAHPGGLCRGQSSWMYLWSRWDGRLWGSGAPPPDQTHQAWPSLPAQRPGRSLQIHINGSLPSSSANFYDCKTPPGRNQLPLDFTGLQLVGKQPQQQAWAHLQRRRGRCPDTPPLWSGLSLCLWCPSARRTCRPPYCPDRSCSPTLSSGRRRHRHRHSSHANTWYLTVVHSHYLWQQQVFAGGHGWWLLLSFPRTAQWWSSPGKNLGGSCRGRGPGGCSGSVHPPAGSDSFQTRLGGTRSTGWIRSWLLVRGWGKFISSSWTFPQPLICARNK